MANIQRQLVSLEMVSDDLSLLTPDECSSEKHIKLIAEYANMLEKLQVMVAQETESSFKRRVTSTVFANVFESKRMINIHIRLIDYVVTYWQTEEKVNQILNTNFDTSVDKRLELLQVKAIRAKAQLKTIVSAMGEDDYLKFVSLINLSDEEWQWHTLLARY